MFKRDNPNGIQYSKVIMAICLITTILCFIAGIGLSIANLITETFAIGLVTTGSAFGMTAIVFFLKKSQAENTMKLYLSAYKEVAKMKILNNEETDSISEMLEQNILTKIDTSFENEIHDATSPIEKQEVFL